MKQTTSTGRQELEPMLSGAEIQELQELVRQVVVADPVFAFAADLVRATRPRDPAAPAFVTELVSWGAGPRASQYLILGGKARALLRGRLHVTTEDIKEVAYPVLRHRLLLNFQAESDRLSTDDILKRLIEAKPAPKGNG